MTTFSTQAIEAVAEALVPDYRTTDQESARRAREAAVGLLKYARSIAALNQPQNRTEDVP